MRSIDFIPRIDRVVDKKILVETAPLVLSMIGDGVHTLFIRSVLFSDNLFKNSLLHNEVAKEVCAKRQATLAIRMESVLNEEELRIFKKAKNAKVNTLPKNASLYEYKLASAFEAITGYLYMLGSTERLAEIYDAIYDDKVTE